MFGIVDFHVAKPDDVRCKTSQQDSECLVLLIFMLLNQMTFAVKHLNRIQNVWYC